VPSVWHASCREQMEAQVELIAHRTTKRRSIMRPTAWLQLPAYNGERASAIRATPVPDEYELRDPAGAVSTVRGIRKSTGPLGR